MGDEVAILLVDDDSIDAEAIVRALRKRTLPNKVVHVQNGLKALEA